MSVAIEAWTRQFKPRTSLSVSEWGRREVKLPFSARSTSFDPDQTYHLREIIDGLTEPGEQIVVGSPGSGKTSIFEVGIPFIIAENPGPVGLAFHDDKLGEQWMSTRGRKVLTNCGPVNALWPGRHKVKKDAIIFPHMEFLLFGANTGSLQGLSLQYLFGDEAWLWRKGMMDEARARGHDRWNGLQAFLGQGGWEKTDFHAAWEATDKREAHFTCPRCGHAQPWIWNQMRYDDVRDKDGIWDYAATAATTRYLCQNTDCARVFLDETAQRRSLASTCHYIPQNPNPLPNRRGHHYNAMVVWWIPWGKLVIEWIKANEAKHRGDFGPLIKFHQKRLALFWKLELESPHGALVGGGYRKGDYINGERIDNEVARFMTIDKQLNHYWAVVRAWRPDGSSRLLFESRVQTDGQLRDLQQSYGVKDSLTFIDARYETAKVYALCIKYKWTAVHGDKASSYPHEIRVRGRLQKVYRYYSPFRYANPGSGTVRYIYFSNEKIKDILSNLRGGNGPEWAVPDDVSSGEPDGYLWQIDSEIKKQTVDQNEDNPKAIAKEVVWRWMRIRKQNHFWDCEVQQVLAANLLGLIGDDLAGQVEESDPPSPSVDTDPAV